MLNAGLYLLPMCFPAHVFMYMLHCINTPTVICSQAAYLTSIGPKSAISSSIHNTILYSRSKGLHLWRTVDGFLSSLAVLVDEEEEVWLTLLCFLLLLFRFVCVEYLLRYCSKFPFAHNLGWHMGSTHIITLLKQNFQRTRDSIDSIVWQWLPICKTCIR